MVIFVFHLYKQRYLNLKQGDLDSDFVIIVKNLSTDIKLIKRAYYIIITKSLFVATLALKKKLFR
jgi:hypothetical protein